MIGLCSDVGNLSKESTVHKYFLANFEVFCFGEKSQFSRNYLDFEIQAIIQVSFK
jgi:hypothetical protein